MKKIILGTLIAGSILFAGGFSDGVSALDNGENLKAQKTFLTLAKSGDIDSQVMLGSMYLDGMGVEVDHEKAFYWFSKAAIQNDSEAQYLLGFMYENGLGLDIDYAQAAKLYEKSSEAGDILAQLNLAIMYKEGRGVQKDMKQAFMWIERANATKENVIHHASL